MDLRQRAVSAWRALVAALPFGRRSLPTAEPPAADDAALTAWSAVEGSELVTWFGVHEAGRRLTADGGALVRLKPGGYQESVDIFVELSGASLVRRARLVLARAWVDHPQTAPFALDLTKSALPILAPGSDTVQQFAERLMSEMGTMRVIMRSPGPPPPAPVTPAIESLIAAYLGRQQRAEAGGILSIENTTADGPALVTITVSAGPAAPWEEMS